jgi:glycosyltransferase involved in cell wall biosynthesis
MLVPLSKVMKFKFAFWGHGANLQDDPNSMKNRFRYFFLNQSDCWFAYTNGVRNFLIKRGVNNNKITVVDNAIDTLNLKLQYDNLSISEVDNLKNEMGVNSDNVAIYCGGIYKEKRIDFLIEASVIIKENISDFHLVFVGAGPEAYRVKEASETYDWIHYVGSKFGAERVPYFKMSELFLMPGLVGLAVLDTFATETPMITTDFPYHSPEIEYLENGKNGVITVNNINDYSKQIIYLFKNKDKIAGLKEGCLNSSALYSTENMVVNFTNGILKCLKH